MKAPPPLERAIHLGIACHLELYAKPGVVWWHTANERKTSPRQGAMLKRMGVKAGVPDFVILIPGPLRVAFLEVKREKTGHLTTAQSVFAERVTDIGCWWSVAYSVVGAIERLTQWGALK